MNVQDAYTYFEKTIKQYDDVKNIFNHLKDDISNMESNQIKSQSNKILNKILKIDIERLREVVQILEKTIIGGDIKRGESTIINGIKNIKSYLYNLDDDREKSKPESEISLIKQKYDFLQKMINDGQVDNSVILKDTNIIDKMLSNIKYENLSEDDYDVMVDMKNYVSDLLKTLKSIEKADKYGPYIRKPLYSLIVKYVTRGDGDEAKKLTDNALDFIESPGRIEMFEPAIKRIIAQKMTQQEFNKFYNIIESGVKNSRKFESFNSYKEYNGIYSI